MEPNSPVYVHTSVFLHTWDIYVYMYVYVSTLYHVPNLFLTLILAYMLKAVFLLKVCWVLVS